MKLATIEIKAFALFLKRLGEHNMDECMDLVPNDGFRESKEKLK